MSIHPEASKLSDIKSIAYTSDLVCPYLSTDTTLRMCLGKNCALYDNCYSEMNYKRGLTRFFAIGVLSMLGLIFMTLIGLLIK